MAGSFADFLENELLDHVFGAATFTPAATLYMGLSTTTITDAGANITEPVGNGYERKAITNNATNFPAASGGAKSNGVEIAFAQATGAWGDILDFFFSDAATGGNIYCYATLNVHKVVTDGDTLTFAIGDLDIALT